VGGGAGLGACGAALTDASGVGEADGSGDAVGGWDTGGVGGFGAGWGFGFGLDLGPGAGRFGGGVPGCDCGGDGRRSGDAPIGEFPC
jgi:hypothetical protein